MDIIDSIFQKLQKTKAPSTLRAKILDIPHTKEIHGKTRMWSMFAGSMLKFALPVLLIAVLVGGYYYQYLRVPKIAAAFELQAETSDAAGVPSNGAFILKSSKPITASQLKKVIHFDPEVDFDVESVGSNTFRIKPAVDLTGDTVYKIQIPEGVGDRDYSWAYQVKAPFLVTSTTPGNKGTYVPTNTVVEVVFNRDNVQKPEDFFEISPKVKGRFEVHESSLVFLPEALKETTVYTVTIRKGLTAEDTEDVLSKDYNFSFETISNSGNGLTSVFSLQRDFEQQLPGKKPTLGVFYYGLDITADVQNADVYKFKSSSDFLKSYTDSRNWDYSWTTFYRNTGISAQVGQATKVSSFKPAIQTVESQNFFELPDALANGFYLVDVTTKVGHSYAWLQISPLAQYFSVTHDKGIMWVKDFNSKQGVNNAEVSFNDGKNSGKSIGKTNGDGLIEFTTPAPLQAESNSTTPAFFTVEASENRTLIVSAQDKWGGSRAYKGDVYWKYLTTDRTIYQMTDTVNFWGIAKGRNEDLHQKNITVGLYNGYFYAGDRIPSETRPLLTKDVLVSNFDTFEGKIDFKGLKPATYSLIVSNGTEVITSISVEVATYTKPSYQLSATASKDYIFAGDPVTFKVSARFFDGTPLPSMTLNYNTYWGGDISGQVTLNDKGEGEVTITPQYREDQYVYYPNNLNVTFYPASAEEGEINAYASVLVFGPHMYLQGYQEKQQGTHYDFKVKLNDINLDQTGVNYLDNYRADYIGNPVSGHEMRADITKFYYEQVETGQAYDPINKTTYKTYRYDEHQEKIASLTGTTDGNGEWNIGQDLAKVKNGYYQVKVYGKDKQGRKLETTFYAYEVGSFINYNGFNPSNPFSIELRIPNVKDNEVYSKEYSVGDKVSLAVASVAGSLDSNAQILYYRYQNNITKADITTSNNYSETFSKEFLPNVQYRAVVLGPYGFVESNTVFANFKSDDRKLNIEIKPDKENYRPGESAKIDFSVKNKDNKGVQAEVNVAVVDEAVFHVQGYSYQQPVLQTLYQSIYTQPIVNFTNFLVLANGGGGGAEKGGCFLAGTKVLMASGGVKNIEDIRIGDEILTRTSEKQGRLVRAVVQGTSHHEVNEYLIVNGSLQVTPEHTVFSNGEWKAIGNVKVGDTMIGQDGKAVVITSIERKSQIGTTVYNIVVNKYHTYFAQGLYVHNAEKGGAERTNFKDTAEFKTITTSSNGEGKLEFTLPDNITSWRVTARGYNASSLLAGEEQKQLPAGLPLFVDGTLAQYYLSGDKPIIKLRTFGTGVDANGSVEYSITSPTLGLNVTKTAKAGTPVEVPLGTMKLGTHELHISSKQGKLSDSLLKKVTVVGSYFRKSEASTVSMKSGSLDIKANGEGTTDIVFADEGLGKYYGMLKNVSYSGGVRSDAQAGSYAAQKLVTQYFGEEHPTNIDLMPYNRSLGISLFTYSDPELEVSAKIADLLPENVQSSDLAQYFNNSLKDEKADAHRVALSLYGLASLHKSVLPKLQSITDNSDFDTTDKVYIALSLAKFGDTENARKMYYNDIRPKLDFNGPEASAAFEKNNSKKVKMTGSIAELVSMLEVNEDAEKLFTYLNTHYPDRDLDTVERALALRERLQHVNLSPASFTVSINGKPEKVELKNGQSKVLRLIADDIKTLKFSDISGNVSVTSYYESVTSPDKLSKNSKISVSRSYEVAGKKTTDLKEGDIIKVTLIPNIGAGALEGEYQVIDYLPSGLKPVTDPYSLSKALPYSCGSTWYPTTIENNTLYFNVYSYFNTDPNCKQITVNYFARVISKGDFTANPALVQSVRDVNYLNVSSSDTIHIK